MGPAVAIPLIVGGWGATVGTIAYQVSQKKATEKGHVVYIYKQSKLSKDYENEKIIEIWIRSCRILHGSVSWLATGAANGVSLGTSDPVEHWWVMIETDKAYYTIQKWNNSQVAMRRVSSVW